MSEQDGVVDWNEALETVGGDKELLIEVIEAFRAEVPELLRQIDEAIASDDPKILQRAAHTMKGSLRYFGATEASGLAIELETLGRNGKVEGAAPVAEKLSRSVGHVADELEQIPD